VSEIDENLNALRDDLVRFLAIEIHDKPHAARVVLIARVVQTLFWWESHE